MKHDRARLERARDSVSCVVSALADQFLCWQSTRLQMCELQMLYTYVTFRCIFVIQVLCGVSGSWALYENGLQMAVAKNTEHATTMVGVGFVAAWRAVACSSY
jgi:hypothetical protein